MNSLTLQKATRRISTNQAPRDYFDFFISGKSLRTILDIENADLITAFGWSTNKKYERHLLNVFRLKEKSQIESGRIMIYVCPECGDIDCGAITAVIKDRGLTIVWSDFAYETNYGGIGETFSQIAPIEFGRADYFSVFSNLPV